MSDLGEGILESFDPDLKRSFEVAGEASEEIKDFSKVKIRKDSLLLSGDGVFYTLQGEGPTTGMPCVFVRLHVCNLRCTWCDAFYTWNPDSEEFWTESKRYSFEEVAQMIRDAWEGPEDMPKRVIWTGGEPLIQKKQIDEVMRLLWGNDSYLHDAEPIPDSDWSYEIETNGTLMPTDLQLMWAQFNCSPKLQNSDNKDYSRLKPKILQALDQRMTSFKFVVTSAEDLDEIERDFLPHISHRNIIIMPQGVTDEEVKMNAQKVAEYCKEKGFRLMTRLQCTLWGARRRV